MRYPTLYDICYLIGGVFALPWVMARKGRKPDGWRERAGKWSDALRRDFAAARGGVWIHSVSLGEAKAAVPMIQALHDEFPGVPLILTAVTRTGLGVLTPLARRVDVVTYVPFDVSWVLEAFVRETRPGLLLVMEKELWPGLLRAASQHGMPMLLINGRVSQRSLRRYRRIRWFIAKMLSRFERVFVQTATDRQRFQQLGAPAERCEALGNLKFDAPPLTADHTAMAESRRRELGLGERDVLWLCGSTHRGEEGLLLSAYRALRARRWPVRLLMAPRHVERIGELERLLQSEGLQPRRISTLRDAAPPAGGARGAGLEVWLLDISGELATWYGTADIAFVGGSLIPHGGQNILEPAAWGVPIITGPHTENFESMVEQFSGAGACRVVRDVRSLSETMEELIRSEELRGRMGRTARALRGQASGATERVMERLRPYLLDLCPLTHDLGPQHSSETVGVGQRSKVKDQRSHVELDASRSALHAQWQHRLRWVLIPLSWVYGGAVRIMPYAYAWGVLKRYSLPCPVISVGNLTWGGTGKTPLVRELVERLVREGHRPAVVSRGYAGHGAEADEVRMLSDQLRGTPVVADHDRVRGARRAVADGADVIVLDDGFQHWRIRRSCDVVTINARDPFGNHRLIPAGSLREPKSALARADVVMVTRTEGLDDASRDALRHTIRLYNRKAAIFDAAYAVTGLRRLPGGDELSVEALTQLAGEAGVALVSGIADPASFARTVLGLGCPVARRWEFPDHHRYTEEDIEDIRNVCQASGIRAVLTTEKDAAKLGARRSTLKGGCEWYAVCAHLEVDDSHGTLAARLAAGLDRSDR